MKDFFFKVCWLAYPAAVWFYMLWCRVYRVVFLRQYDGIAVPGFKAPEEAVVQMRKVAWKPDGILQIYDECGTAQRFQYILDQINRGRPQPEIACDCDDYAAWGVVVLHPRYKPRMLFVAWQTITGGIGGHAVCVFYDPKTGRYGHIGNWGIFTDLAGDSAIAKSIANDAGSRKFLGYTVTTCDLEVLECRRA